MIICLHKVLRFQETTTYTFETAGAEEYTEYVSAKRQDPKTNVLYMTLNNLRVRL